MESGIPIHPMVVHFPIAAWLLGTGVLLAALIARKPQWRGTAWFLLVVGAVMSVPAALTGRNDLADLAVATDPDLLKHRDLGNLLPWLMMGLVLLRAHAHFRKPPLDIPAWIWAGAATILAAILVVTGHLGAKLVYIKHLGF